MRVARAFSRWLSPAGIRAMPSGCSSPILLITAAYLTVGVAAFVAWRTTGDAKWVERFFRAPGAIVLVWLSVVESWLSVRVWRHYSPGEPMHLAWVLISISALADMAGTTLIQVLAFHPIALGYGHFLGGPLRFALLAAGLYWALRVYRTAGFLGRLSLLEWLLLALAAVYVFLEAAGIVVAVQDGKKPDPWEVLRWPVDPLLGILLAEAFLLRSSVERMGQGWIGRSWKAFSAGVFLVLLGNIGRMAEAYGYLPWPWSSLTWYVWIPAACTFALAPAFQLEAIQRATSGESRPE